MRIDQNGNVPDSGIIQATAKQSEAATDQNSQVNEMENIEIDDSDHEYMEIEVDPQYVEDVQQVKETVWEYERTFEDQAEFDKFMKEEENWWSFLKGVSRNDGFKTVFRCNNVKRRDTPCASGIYTVKNRVPNDTSIELYRKNADHTCPENGGALKKPQKDAVECIIGLVKSKNPLKTIMFKLRDDPRFRGITKNQVQYVINKYNRETYGNPAVTLKDLEDFVKLHNQLPIELDEPFVVNFFRSAPNDTEKIFRIFYSTKRLLQFATESDIIHIDGTYKIMIQGFPVVIVGVTDYAKRFHLCGLTICSSESASDYQFVFESLMHGVIMVTEQDLRPRAVMADASAAITRGLEDSFEDENIVRLNCFAHIMMNVDKCELLPENKELVKNDVRTLQKSFDHKTFEVGSKLFIEKWMVYEQKFAEHFDKVYLKSNNNWYGGCAPRAPKTNNALESFNKSLKQHQTHYKRSNLSEFKVRALEIVRERSKEYIEDKKPPQTSIEISEQLLKDAWDYSCSKKSFVTQKNAEDVDFYVFGGSNEDKITNNDVKTFLNQKFTDFDDFAEKAFLIHKITFKQNSHDWASHSLCTCHTFSKEYICKHIVAIAYRLGILNVPDAVVAGINEGPIAPKNKRGRPRKATKALIRD